MSARQIVNLETGKSTRPHYTTACAIADCLGIDVRVAFPHGFNETAAPEPLDQ